MKAKMTHFHWLLVNMPFSKEDTLF